MDGSLRLVTVGGALDPAGAGITDAHNHVWIAPVPGALPGAPILAAEASITAELIDYRSSGGRTIVDCQPPGCGRDGRMLAKLEQATGVQIVACTGIHLARYYPPDDWLWRASSEQAARFFLAELTRGLVEWGDMAPPVQAGFVKAACPARLEDAPGALFDAAAAAAGQTGAALTVHTEQGQAAIELVDRFARLGLPPGRLVLFHMDKRPDFGLHRDLAQAGVLLEYDTFYRPKYQPEQGVWPLLEKMAAAGLDGQVAIGTDIADPALWARTGNGPGLAGLINRIMPRLHEMGLSPATISRLTGGNIANRLARPI